MKEAKEFAESIAAIFIETSARNAVNVEELFQKISRFNAFPVWCVGTMFVCMHCTSVDTFLIFEMKCSIYSHVPVALSHLPYFNQK